MKRVGYRAILGASLVVAAWVGTIEVRHRMFVSSVGSCCPRLDIRSRVADHDMLAYGRCLGSAMYGDFVHPVCRVGMDITDEQLEQTNDLSLVVAIRRQMRGLEVPWEEFTARIEPISLVHCKPRVASAVLREWARQLASGAPEPDAQRLVDIGGIGALFVDALVRQGSVSSSLLEAFLDSGGDTAPYQQSRTGRAAAILEQVNQSAPNERLDQFLNLLVPLDPDADIDNVFVAPDILDFDSHELAQRFETDVVRAGTRTRKTQVLANLYAGVVAIGRGLELPADIEATLPTLTKQYVGIAKYRRRNSTKPFEPFPYLLYHWSGFVSYEATEAWISQQGPRRRAHLRCENIEGWHRWFDL